MSRNSAPYDPKTKRGTSSRGSSARGASARKSGARSAMSSQIGVNMASGTGGPQDNSRMHKINEVMHRDLAKLISLECKDPRLGMITVTGVNVSKDLSIAKVFVTVLEEDKMEQSLQILNGASGFFRSRLSQLIKLRKMPALRFVYDGSVVAGSRINSIFAKLENSTSKDDEQEEDSESA